MKGVQKKGRRETRRKQTRGGHTKWLWEKENPKPGSEAEEGRDGPLGYLALYLGSAQLSVEGWLAGWGKGLLRHPGGSFTCRRSTLKGLGFRPSQTEPLDAP